MWNNTYDRAMEIGKDKLGVSVGGKYLEKRIMVVKQRGSGESE